MYRLPEHCADKGAGTASSGAKVAASKLSLKKPCLLEAAAPPTSSRGHGELQRESLAGLSGRDGAAAARTDTHGAADGGRDSGVAGQGRRNGAR